jgi:hypothetical protein
MSEEQKPTTETGAAKRRLSIFIFMPGILILVMGVSNASLSFCLNRSHQQVKELNKSFEDLKKNIRINCLTSAAFGYTCGSMGVPEDEFAQDCAHIFSPTNGMITDIQIHLHARSPAPTNNGTAAALHPKVRL